MATQNNNYSPKVMTAMKKAESLARNYRSSKIEQVHFLYACLLDSNKVQRCIQEMGINQAHLVSKLKQIISLNSKGKLIARSNADVEGSAALIKAIQKADSEKSIYPSKYIDTIHIFLSMVRYPDNGMSSVIEEYGITIKRITETFPAQGEKNIVQEPFDNTAEGENCDSKEENNKKVKNKEDTMSKFCFDMVEAAKTKNPDPVIGRDSEIRNMILILSRKKKNNPCLIGEPGVGKTAVVEGLAQRIASGDVPDSLKNKKLLSVDLGAMVAGAKYRGEFEERLQKLLNSVKEDNGNTLLFIDELHNIVGAGASDSGTMDASNMLKPMLARGELHCIGATTLDEYRKYISKDPALERRFQTVEVKEPTEEDAIAILRGLKLKFEIFHGIKILDDALVSAVRLSSRYITDKYLPDKAIDLVDESCALIKNELDTMPLELDKLSRKIIQLEMEEAVLAKESMQSGSKEKLMKFRMELETLQEKFRTRKAQWENEKKSVDHVSMLRCKIDLLNTTIDDAKKNGDIETASAIAFGELPKLVEDLEREEESIANNGSMVREKVTEEEIAQTISRWTGIPLTKLSETDRERTLHLGEELHQRVIGQELAVKKVSQSIIRSRAGIKDPNRPIGSFLFLGPTGVGKTELAKTLADSLFDSANNFIRLDMTEFMEKHSVSRLIGAPPGYVGHDEGGQLTEAVRRNPYSVVLFDEVEKAHPDVMNILLQIFDDGRVTDSQGKLVDCKNTILILTSNLGAQYLINGIDEEGNILPKAEENVKEELRKFFRPELLNRIDETIMFKPLTLEDNRKIAGLIVKNLNKRLKEKNVEISFTKEALDMAIENGYDPNFGARPLKRYFQDNIETLVAIALLENKIIDGKAMIDYCDGEFVVLGEDLERTIVWEKM